MQYVWHNDGYKQRNSYTAYYNMCSKYVNKNISHTLNLEQYTRIKQMLQLVFNRMKRGAGWKE
jgi:hypothetical protein